MSNATAASGDRDDQDDLKPTFTEGYKISEKKSPEELAKLDAEDESLNRWKASLGLSGGAVNATGSGPKVSVKTLFLTSPTLPSGKRIEIDLTNPSSIANIKKNPINIKEGIEYKLSGFSEVASFSLTKKESSSVGITFKVNHSIISGVRYIHIVKRSGVKVDKHEQMLGSYGPSPTGEAYTKNFDPEESPSGLLARSGTYTVKSRVVDDDGEVYSDFEWVFKLTKEW